MREAEFDSKDRSVRIGLRSYSAITPPTESKVVNYAAAEIALQLLPREHA